LSISGIKTNYQPGETISGNISFRLHNAANSSAIQQLLIGIIDAQNKVIDVKCVYNGAPKTCPEWTTGTASFSLKTPVTPGNYKVIAADYFEYSCSDAINKFPSLYSSTSPYCKDITTITISAIVGSNTLLIIVAIALLVLLFIFSLMGSKTWKRVFRFILVLAVVSFLGYLFWKYGIPWFIENLSTIIGVLLSLGALTIAGTAAWKNWDSIRNWIDKQVGPPEPDEPTPPNVTKGILFEQECKAVLEKMGFSCETTKISGDGGIDLIARSNKPLISGIYIIQCKDWKNRPVGEKEIRDLYGTVTSERANKGILITTSYFTKAALSFAQGKNIELIDGDRLNKLSGHQ
jgi:hypothetical protein